MLRAAGSRSKMTLMSFLAARNILPRPSRQLHDYFYQLFSIFIRKGRIFFRRFSLMPFTLSRSSGDRNPPTRSLSATIASAMASEIPGSALISSFKALFISITLSKEIFLSCRKGTAPGACLAVDGGVLPSSQRGQQGALRSR